MNKFLCYFVPHLFDLRKTFTFYLVISGYHVSCWKRRIPGDRNRTCVQSAIYLQGYFCFVFQNWLSVSNCIVFGGKLLVGRFLVRAFSKSSHENELNTLGKMEIWNDYKKVGWRKLEAPSIFQLRAPWEATPGQCPRKADLDTAMRMMLTLNVKEDVTGCQHNMILQGK